MAFNSAALLVNRSINATDAARKGDRPPRVQPTMKVIAIGVGSGSVLMILFYRVGTIS